MNTCIRKFKSSDTPASVCRSAADFCNVYVIAKGKISISRAASTSVPHYVPNLIQYPSNGHPALADHPSNGHGQGHPALADHPSNGHGHGHHALADHPSNGHPALADHLLGHGAKG